MSLKDDQGYRMNQSVTIAPRTGNGLHGPTYGSAVPYACIIQYVIDIIKDKDGKEAKTTAQVYLDAAVSVTENDKISIGSATPPILKVSPEYDDWNRLYQIIVYT